MAYLIEASVSRFAIKVPAGLQNSQGSAGEYPVHIHSVDIDKIQFLVDCWPEEALSFLQCGPLPRATDNMVSSINQNEEEGARGDKQIRNWSLL